MWACQYNQIITVRYLVYTNMSGWCGGGRYVGLTDMILLVGAIELLRQLARNHWHYHQTLMPPTTAIPRTS